MPCFGSGKSQRTQAEARGGSLLPPRASACFNFVPGHGLPPGMRPLYSYFSDVINKTSDETLVPPIPAIEATFFPGIRAGCRFQQQAALEQITFDFL
ncbi:hypothetical protein [Desulfovibrio sp. ZJ200]|uniref:hypothetical protein n=1 Tax=Desulfovibrio sp. ZJ200 TaxID=2709792 RepID=UPI0013EBA26B|nr:hypothetical protein [Desulfovibrio sp. ZJ200]